MNASRESLEAAAQLERAERVASEWQTAANSKAKEVASLQQEVDSVRKEAARLVSLQEDLWACENERAKLQELLSVAQVLS
jgi:ubiquinone biosynthesis protein UbiJ